MKQDLLVSIVTACYNSEKTIAKTMDSLLAQTYQNFEYIIIDGASSDGTLAVIEQYRAAFGARLTVISEKDKGIYDAMNKGIAMAKGTLVGMINSDDWYEADALAQVVQAYEGQTHCVLYGMLRQWNKGKLYSVHYHSHEFIHDRMIPHPTCFVTNETYQTLGMYSLEYRSAADYDFMLTLTANPTVSFVPIFAVLANFDMGGISSGQIGFREAADIRLKHHLIGRSQWAFIQLKSRLLTLLGK